MTGAVFVDTLRKSWRGTLYWGVGLALFAVVLILMLPDMGELQKFAELVASMPPLLVQMLGAGDVAFMATPEGFLATKFYDYALMMFSIYAILAGLNVTANEEDRGILDVTLSLPIQRWRIVAERLLAFALLMVGMILIMIAGSWLALLAMPSVEVAPATLFNATVNVLPGALLMMAFTAFVATIFTRRRLAVSVAVIFLIGSYMANVIGAVASDAISSALRTISFYSYYDSVGVMKNGLSLPNMALLVVVAVVLGAGALVFFQRRDVSV